MYIQIFICKSVSHYAMYLYSLKEKCLSIEEDNNLLQQKLDSYKKEKKFQNNKSEKQYEDILMKVIFFCKPLYIFFLFDFGI